MSFRQPALLGTAPAVSGGVEIVVPNKFLSGDQPGVASKWRRALLKLTKLSKEEAQKRPARSAGGVSRYG